MVKKKKHEDDLHPKKKTDKTEGVIFLSMSSVAGLTVLKDLNSLPQFHFLTIANHTALSASYIHTMSDAFLQNDCLAARVEGLSPANMAEQ